MQPLKMQPLKMQPLKMQPLKMQPLKMQPLKMQPLILIQPLKLHPQELSASLPAHVEKNIAERSAAGELPDTDLMRQINDSIDNLPKFSTWIWGGDGKSKR
jgi:hypothetical protein